MATRDRVIAAARALFDEIGYEATTVRMIAERAGVAIGSVFTTFASKADVLNFILLEQFGRLFEELDRLAPHLQGSTRERIAQLLAIAYAVEREQLGLMMAHLSASHGWPGEIEVESERRQARLVALLTTVLKRGVDAGDVRCDIDLGVTVDLILAAYLRNYRTAWYKKLDADALGALMRRQLDVIFAGLAPAHQVAVAA